MGEDIFSKCSNDESLLALLLYVGPQPADIVRLSIASPFVRKQLSTESFCRKFFSLYLSVPVQDVPGMNWQKELEAWWKLRYKLFHTDLEIQGSEMKQLQEEEDRPVYEIEWDHKGIFTVEHVMRMVQRSQALSASLPNEPLDLQMMIFQPPGRTFPHLPLSRCPSMYYEVRIAKSIPKLGGAIIGYALPSLKTTLPGKTTYSFGVALDELISFNGFSDLPEKIPSPRGNTFKPKKGDIFGVGLIYSLTDTPPSSFSYLPDHQPGTHSLYTDIATFYVTFNGRLIYNVSNACSYQVVPTIVLSTFGDALQVNFGTQVSPRAYFADNGMEMLKNGHVGPELARFYRTTWKFNPYNVHTQLLKDVYDEYHTKVGSDGAEEKSVVSTLERTHYWCSLEEQAKIVPIATDEMLWVDACYHLFGVNHQNTMDFMATRIASHGYEAIVDMHSVAKCMEAANLQNLVANQRMDVERARTLMLTALANEQDVQHMLNHPEPLEVFLHWTESLVRYWERRLAWELITFLKTDVAGRYVVDHVPILFSWIVLDSLYFSQQTADSPIYDCLETISNRWFKIQDIESCIVSMLKAVCQMFWMSRANNLYPHTTKHVPQAPSIAYLGIQWTTHFFQSVGLLPANFDSLPISTGAAHVLSKEKIAEIYQSLNEEQLSHLHQAVICAFAGSHCAYHSPDSISSSEPWLPPDPIEAIHATLSSILEQRKQFRMSKPFLDSEAAKKDIFNLLGGAAKAVFRINHPKGTLRLPPDMDHSFIYLQLSRYSDNFLELTQFLQSRQNDGNLDWKRNDVRNQIQWYWNEKCAFIALWYGEQYLLNVISDLFPDFPRDLIVSYKHQPALQPIAAPGRMFNVSRMIALGILSAGLAIGATLVFRRGRRILGWK